MDVSFFVLCTHSLMTSFLLVLVVFPLMDFSVRSPSPFSGGRNLETARDGGKTGASRVETGEGGGGGRGKISNRRHVIEWLLDRVVKCIGNQLSSNAFTVSNSLNRHLYWLFGNPVCEKIPFSTYFFRVFFHGNDDGNVFVSAFLFQALKSDENRDLARAINVRTVEIEEKMCCNGKRGSEIFPEKYQSENKIN